MAKTIDELVKVFTGVYYLEDTSIIPLICAAVLSNRMPGDAVWLMIVGGSGSGKCHGKGTKILMYDGSVKNVEDIIVGDKIMGDDCGPRNILSTTKGTGQLYEVIQSNGMSYVVNDAHILSLFKEKKIIDINVVDFLKLDAEERKRYLGFRIQHDIYYHFSSIEIIKKDIGDYYGFEIDGNKRYQLEDGTVTHNTELINAVTDLKFVFQLSTLTSNTLLSGMKVKGKDSSLLLRIPKTSVLVMKDFTTILSMGKEDQQEIMAQLREVYDGKMHKSTGNGEDIKWEGKVNLIAGVTEKIFVMEHKFSGGGLRTINYCLPEPDHKGRIATTRRSAKIASGIKEYREYVKKEFTEFIELMIPRLPDFSDEVDEKLSEELVALSEFVTLSRSPVERDYTGRIHMKLAPEMPMRLSNQLHLLAKALMVMSGGILPIEYKKILYKIALDSIPKGRRMVLKSLAGVDYGNTKGIATSLNYPTDTVRPWLEDLNAFGIVTREEGGGRSGDKWYLANQYKDMMSTYDNISTKGGALEIDEDEDDGSGSGYQGKGTKLETDWGDFVD